MKLTERVTHSFVQDTPLFVLHDWTEGGKKWLIPLIFEKIVRGHKKNYVTKQMKVVMKKKSIDINQTHKVINLHDFDDLYCWFNKTLCRGKKKSGSAIWRKFYYINKITKISSNIVNAHAMQFNANDPKFTLHEKISSCKKDNFLRFIIQHGKTILLKDLIF